MLDHQPAIARAMGFEDEPRLIAIDGLMRATFEHARQIEFLLRAAILRFLEEGSKAVTPPTTRPASCGAPRERTPAGSRRRASSTRSRTPTCPRRSTGTTRSARRSSICSAARTAERRRWRSSTGSDGRSGSSGVGPTSAADRNAIRTTDPRSTPTCSVLSDVGEARGRGRGGGRSGPGGGGPARHGPAGARARGTAPRHREERRGRTRPGRGAGGRQILDRIGVDAATGDLVAFLVAQHLLLSDTATRRDLTDENPILDVAAAVGTPDRLAALYLLAKADAEATGPAAWTPWRRTLIHELVAKVQHVLERGAMGTEIAEDLAVRVDRVRAFLEREPQDDVEAFLARVPRAYLLAVEPERVARHYPTIQPPVGALDVRAVHLEGGRAGTYELLVVARDRAGLLSWIAGRSRSPASRSSPRRRSRRTTASRLTASRSRVWEPVVPDRRWREFRGVLRRAIDGSMPPRAAGRGEAPVVPPPAVSTPVSVVVDDGASDFATAIEVARPTVSACSTTSRARSRSSVWTSTWRRSPPMRAGSSTRSTSATTSAGSSPAIRRRWAKTAEPSRAAHPLRDRARSIASPRGRRT